MSIGSLLEPEPLVLSAIGPVPGLLASVLGVSIGVALYYYVPQRLAPQSCGCAGDCACS